MTHLEFLTLFGSFTIVGQENVSTSQTQQIRKPLGHIKRKTNSKVFWLLDNIKSDAFAQTD
jgi:hypothetical protein